MDRFDSFPVVSVCLSLGLSVCLSLSLSLSLSLCLLRRFSPLISRLSFLIFLLPISLSSISPPHHTHTHTHTLSLSFYLSFYQSRAVEFDADGGIRFSRTLRAVPAAMCDRVMDQRYLDRLEQADKILLPPSALALLTFEADDDDAMGGMGGGGGGSRSAQRRRRRREGQAEGRRAGAKGPMLFRIRTFRPRGGKGRGGDGRAGSDVGMGPPVYAGVRSKTNRRKRDRRESGESQERVRREI